MMLLSSFMVEAQTYSLSQCRESALKNNREVALSRTRVEKALHDQAAYKTLFYPKFTLMATDLYSTGSGKMTIHGGNLPIFNLDAESGSYSPDVTLTADGQTVYNRYAYFPDKDINLKISNFFTGGITFEQPLYMGGKITAVNRMASIGTEVARTGTRLTDSEVILSTDEAYVMVVRAKELCKVAEQYQSMLAELYRNVESAFRHGMKTKNDMLKVQVKQNEVELQLQKAQNGLRLAKMNLCHVMGLPLDSPIDVSMNDIRVDDGLTALSTDITQRPEYVMLGQKVELAGEQVKLTRSEFMPNVALVGGYTYNNGMRANHHTLIHSGGASVMVTASFPVFHFNEGRHKVNAAKTDQLLAEIERNNLNEKMELELAQARNNMEEAGTEVALTTKSLEQSDENVKSSKSQYDNGMEPLSDLLEAQTLWQQAYANAIEARCNLFLMHTKYMKAAGLLR